MKVRTSQPERGEDAKGNGQVFILHGSADEVIPVRMSRQMAAELPSTVHFTEVPNAHHNTIQEIAIPEIETALDAARK